MRVLWKLGGSVLSHPALRTRLDEWSRLWTGTPSAWIAGGGIAADAVRAWDAAHGLGDETSHDLALAAMDLNAELLQSLLPDARLVRSGSQCEAAWQDQRPAVLCASCMVPWGEQTSGTPLPRTWELTSDSIAAWLATRLGVDRLVLVKSVPPPDELSLASQTGYVDPRFAAYARTVPEVWTVSPDNPEPRQWFVRD